MDKIMDVEAKGRARARERNMEDDAGLFVKKARA